MLTQIKLRENGSSVKNGKNKGFKVMDLFGKMWKAQESNSKSCGNLHVL